MFLYFSLFHCNHFKNHKIKICLIIRINGKLIWPKNRRSVYNCVIIPKWSLTLYPEAQIAKNQWGSGLIYLFNGISTHCGLFNAKIWFISKCLFIIITFLYFLMFCCIYFLKSISNHKIYLIIKNKKNLIWPRNRSVFNCIIIPKWSLTLHPEAQMAKNSWGIWFGLFYLFNAISTPNGLFTTNIWLIYKCLIIIITVYILNIPWWSFFLNQ